MNNNNILNQNELINKAIYSIIVLFFTLIFWFSRNIYNSNIELQNQIQDMSKVMLKLTYTIDNFNNIFNETKIEIKEIKQNLNEQEKDILIIKSIVN